MRKSEEQLLNELKVQAAVELIRCVYDQPNGSTGGGCHVVLDDDNLEDEHIDWTLGQSDLTDIERLCMNQMKELSLLDRWRAIHLFRKPDRPTAWPLLPDLPEGDLQEGHVAVSNKSHCDYCSSTIEYAGAWDDKVFKSCRGCLHKMELNLENFKNKQSLKEEDRLNISSLYKWVLDNSCPAKRKDKRGVGYPTSLDPYRSPTPRCPDCDEAYPAPAEMCVCSQPLFIVIPPGQHVHIKCPVHGDVKIYGGATY